MKHKIIKTYITIGLLAVTAAIPAASAQNQPVAPITLRADIDTTAVTMGERTTLRVELIKNGHVGTVVSPVQSAGEGKESVGGIEIRQTSVDSTDLGNNRIQVNYEMLLQPFDPGDFIIPSFKYALDADTFSSNPIALKVLEPEIPQEMRDSLYINPLRPPMEIESEWYDWIPDLLSDYWYWWLIGLVCVALAVILPIMYRKNGGSILPRKKVIPPYNLAMQRLLELKNKQLHQQGNNKAYYTELTDILRQYLGGRFKIYALEMTSSQILEELDANPETAPFADELRPMFRIADFVKFAKQQSTPDENIKSYNAVVNFVEETKPLEQSQQSDKNKTI